MDGEKNSGQLRVGMWLLLHLHFGMEHMIDFQEEFHYRILRAMMGSLRKNERTGSHELEPQTIGPGQRMKEYIRQRMTGVI